MIVVDASFVMKLPLNEPDSPQVRAQWRIWEQSGETIIAPPLFWPEVLSVVRQRIYRAILSEAEGDRALEGLERLEIDVREPHGIYHVAWQLARRFNRPTIYDCCYLALADIAGCDFWTADRRLVNVVSPSLPWVRSPWLAAEEKEDMPTP